MKGKFIVFEGGEGSGKTTQIDLVQQWLHSVQPQTEIVVTREPGGSELGKVLRYFLLNWAGGEAIQKEAELFLYMADRAQHVRTVLMPALERGAIVLCDRYVDSTIAYQGYAHGMDIDHLYQMNAVATNWLHADLTLWLDIEAREGLARIDRKLDRMEQIEIGFHERVRLGYRAIWSRATAHGRNILRVDATPPKDEVFVTVQQLISELLSIESTAPTPDAV